MIINYIIFITFMFCWIFSALWGIAEGKDGRFNVNYPMIAFLLLSLLYPIVVHYTLKV